MTCPIYGTIFYCRPTPSYNNTGGWRIGAFRYAARRQSRERNGVRRGSPLEALVSLMAIQVNSPDLEVISMNPVKPGSMIRATPGGVQVRERSRPTYAIQVVHQT